MWDDLSMLDILFVPDAVEGGLAVVGNEAMYRIDPGYVVAPFMTTNFYDTSPLEAFDNRQGLSVDHLMGSTSLPPAFPITRVGGGAYWDGGLVSNAPLGRALNALEEPDQCDIDTHTEVIVVDLFRTNAEVPTNLIDVLWCTFEIMFSS
jgi:NTE family protein